jgi:site-specific recombinase XerD
VSEKCEKTFRTLQIIFYDTLVWQLTTVAEKPFFPMMESIVKPGARISVENMVLAAENYLKELGYNPNSIWRYRQPWRAFCKFAKKSARGQAFSYTLAERFQESEGVFAGSPHKSLSPWQHNLRAAMRVITEYHQHGCFQRRQNAIVKSQLPADMKRLVDRYETFCIRNRNMAKSTLRMRRTHIVRFLHFLRSRGIRKMNGIKPEILSDFVSTCAHFERHTLATMGTSLRSLFRFFCAEGVTSADISGYVPQMRYCKHARIPTVWKQEQVDAILNAVDRSSPIGKRDYAILLLAARLGIRAGDIRALHLDNLRWDEARIEFNQSKTKQPLSLPMTEEIGCALIDYLQHGRPITSSRQVFVRHRAPFEHLADRSSLHYIITMYRRRAGIKLPEQNRQGMHSLRYSLASRLLDAGTPLDTISNIMGHVSPESTHIYTKIDINALRKAAIDPEEVCHA